MDYGQLNWVRSWPTTKPFALSPSKGMPDQGQGFDRLSPNGGVEGPMTSAVFGARSQGNHLAVIPAHAGIQPINWAPAFAGATTPAQ
jgi:hypothetical protein